MPWNWIQLVEVGVSQGQLVLVARLPVKKKNKASPANRLILIKMKCEHVKLQETGRIILTMTLARVELDCCQCIKMFILLVQLLFDMKNTKSIQCSCSFRFLYMFIIRLTYDSSRS